MFQELLARLAGELDAARLPYMIIGGQAVLVHGEPRLTRDIDITVGATTAELDAVLQAARNAGLHPLVENPIDFVRDTWVLPCSDEKTDIRVDLMFSFTTYEREAMTRAVTITIGNRPVRIATAEDLVILKILAGRPRDLEDARTVLLKNPQLDHDYVARCLRELDAEKELPVMARYTELKSKLDIR
ncbi:MAG: hypothetical protein FJY56_12535 [Betaproteobacteria bacterium]|nr:hypothetical protein [Betaproteobacteria bacterium]